MTVSVAVKVPAEGGVNMTASKQVACGARLSPSNRHEALPTGIVKSALLGPESVIESIFKGAFPWSVKNTLKPGDDVPTFTLGS